MPNWVTNNLTITGPKKDIDAFVAKHITKDCIDFDTIIPEPRKRDDCPENCIVNENSYVQLDEKRPWFNWYEWRIQYWGCKWNAARSCEGGENIIRVSDTELTVTFDTPWDAPFKVIYVLGALWPSLRIEHISVEEQGPEYTDRIVFENGEAVIEIFPEPESKEAYEIMFELWGNEDYYYYDEVEGTYKEIFEDKEAEA